jgi:molybdopterin-guanine dinucleotide biosynthesis protein A
MTKNQKDSSQIIKGLILIGGKSTRMGTDKSELNYHGKPQKEFVRDLLVNEGIETFYSVKPFNCTSTPPSAGAQGDKKKLSVVSSEIEKSQPTQEIPDMFENLGPFGGICSAFQKDPNSAWFVLATDLPFVDKRLVKLLLKKRNPTKVATTVKGKRKQFPEPLVTIFEPKAYPIFLHYLAEGNASPRDILIHSDVEIVEVEDALIRNVNTPEEYEATKQELI